MNNSFFKMTGRFLFAMSLSFFATRANAQAILPAAWNFDVAAPPGWTEVLNFGTTTTRYAAGQTGQACRLDGTGDYVLAQFAEEPGNITYYMKGQNSGGAWQGTFTVEESVNGTTFTPLRTFNTGEMPTATYTLYTDSPNPESRYIRWFYTNKVSGHNAALDEINILTPATGAAQEINVQQSGNNIPTGLTATIGNASSTIFTIQNLGTAQTLTINSITLSGPDAAQFSLAGIPSSVAPNGSENFTLLFDGQGSGSKFCTITIDNNDTSEGLYVINIYAVAGSLATEPSAQPTGLNFTGVNAWDFNFGFTAATGAERYLVLRRKNAAVTDSPEDGTTYVKGQWIGNSQIVHIGSAGTYNARNIESSTAYHFAVFAFNGPQGYENYLTSSPLTGSTTTQGPNIGNVYSGVDNTSPLVVAQLTAAMNPSNYFQVFYSSYISTLINEFYVKDTVQAGVAHNAVECQYSGTHYIYPAGFQFWNGEGPGTISREHVYPQSWMPTYFSAGFDDSPEVSDLHNLLPVLQVECNAVRSNYPYGNVTGTIANSYLSTKLGNNSLNQRVYEPRDKIKGDAARAVMYHAVKNNTATNDFSFPEQISLIIPYGQNEYVLKQWHFNDLPDNYEIARNEYIRSRQNNRNAFIDSVLFPCYVRFSNLTKWVPQFTTSNGVFTALDPAVTYQWYLNGSPISGATSDTFTPSVTGSYSLEARQFNQCPSFVSPQITWTGVGEIDQSNLAFRVFPNPNQGRFNVELNLLTALNLQIRVLDVTGKVVMTENRNLSSGIQLIQMDHNLPQGVYFVEAQSGKVHTTQRIVVE